MSRPVALIGEDIGPANLARLRQEYPAVDFCFCPDAAAFVEAAARAEIIFSKSFPAGSLEAATGLGWVQAGTAGVDRLLTGLAGRDVLLTNASGAHGVPMAELMLGMMLGFAARLHTASRGPADYNSVRAQILREKFELEGQTLCVLGLGDIGGTLARKARALGMRVIGVRRGRDPFPHVDAQATPDRLLEVLPQADHVALCLPLTSETVGIVGATELRAMRASAYIYNVGRGSSIDPDALVQALQTGGIAGAGLDVTDPEPLPADSPLWALPNVVLSRHTSGSSPYNADRITAIFAENLNRYLAGKPLLHQVDRQLGY
ncbi:MAG: D-2-hydroxyacid dehydrogenase [Caldilineaceae bacterium]|nr:D-2-hydroxyacid dehydrogenase [Caldilineaceae bacterium]